MPTMTPSSLSPLAATGAPASRARAPVRRSLRWRLRSAGLALAGLVGLAGAGPTLAEPSAEPPRRVVSINLCTDQLAMLIAAPGQLVSVSRFARDPGMSLMTAEADRFPINHGLAEEVFRLEPDLVLAGTFTKRATVNLLRRLDRRVEEFAPANDFDDIRAAVRRMGELLGQETRAQALIAGLDAELAAAREHAGRPRPTPAPVIGSFAANSFTTGDGTLENAIVTRAGYRHLGADLGLAGTTRLPLEALVLADPDYLLVWERYASDPSRAAAVVRHPALEARFGETRRVAADTRAWICGTPLTASAITRLRAAVDAVTPRREAAR